MATIRKRGRRWQVQVRRQNQKGISRTFSLKSDAEAWARRMEIQTEQRDIGLARNQLQNTRLRDLVERYQRDVISHKRSKAVEDVIITAFLRHPIGDRSLLELTGADFAAYRDQRLTRVKPVTVARELGIIRHCFELARREWDIPLDQNPLDGFRRAGPIEGRCRRLRPGELEQLLEATTACRNPHMRPLVVVAVETAMRQGELLRARWHDIDNFRQTLHVPETKNGHPRSIPLSPRAYRMLVDLQPEDTDRIFPTTASAVKQAWRRLIRRAGIADLKFHDLRHEGISRFLECGLTIAEVSQVSGHRDYRALLRYAHAQPSEIRRKLADPPPMNWSTSYHQEKEDRSCRTSVRRQRRLLPSCAR